MPKINLLNTSGKSSSSLTLPTKIFAAKINPTLMAQAVRVYLANQRQAPAHTKSRGQIQVSKKKVWRQKGTGRARHGSRNAPIFVGGAKAHGPRGNQNFSLKLSKKMKRLSLFSALTQQFQAKHILVVDGFDKLSPQTKQFDKVFQKLQSPPQKICLILDQPSSSITRATRNLPYLTLSLSPHLHTYQVLNHQTLIFTPAAVKTLETHYLKPNLINQTKKSTPKITKKPKK